MAEPAERFYESQGLQLHYADWGNETAPPLILIHGGLDHCRNWDAIARELQPHFHIMAPDLRGHGDSEWAKGSSYGLSDNVYDLTRLMRFAEIQDAAIVGHSMGGMVALGYAGTYPDRVSRLVVLDGAFLSGSQPAPIAEQMSRWIDQLDRISEYEPSAFKTIEEAAQRLSARNKRLTPELALHLARHGVRQDADGRYRSLPAGEGAVPALDGRLHRFVVAHYLSYPADVGQRKLSSRPRGRWPARLFQGRRTREGNGRRTLASS